MTNLASRVVKDMVTLADGQTYDIARIFAICIIPVYIGMGVGELVMAPTPFDFQAFGVGFGAILTGLGAFLFLKNPTEPKQ